MRFLWLIPITLVALLDQITKLFVVLCLDEYESFTVIEGVLNFTRISNDGAAFGMLDNARWVFMLASTLLIIAVIAFMLVFYKKYYHPLLYTALSFIVGGGIGNMIDRIFFVNVVDFIDIKFIPFWKWIFNVADVFVCVGAGIVVLYFILDDISERKKKKSENAQSTTDN